jgi:hypothetical protein
MAFYEVACLKGGAVQLEAESKAWATFQAMKVFHVPPSQLEAREIKQITDWNEKVEYVA